MARFESIEQSGQLTPQEMAYEREMFDKQTAFQLKIKELELEVAKIEARWGSWLKLPGMIIKLPLYVLLGIAYIVSMITKKEVPKEFWDLLK